MGARGPLPKSENRQRRDEGAQAPVVVWLREVGTGGAYPDPPPGLVDDVQEQWKELFRAGGERWLMTVDIPALERLFVYRSEHARIMDYLRTLPPERLVVTGSKGQERSHPLLDTVLKLEREARALEDKLGLLPLSRARLGLTVAESRRRSWEEVARVDAAAPDAAELEALGLTVTTIDELL